MFWFKKPKKLNETTRLYALYGESANLSFLDSAIKDNNSKIDINTNNIETNRNNIVANANRIEEVNNKIDNLPSVDLTEVNNRINNNTRNIATNVTNINNLNTKVNKITNDLSNANIASYKGTWNSNTTYMVGDIVNIGDKFYLAVVRNSNSQPPENGNDKWKLLTFTVDTSSFITDSALNPLRNDISTNRNDISTNRSNISTLTNRVDNIVVNQPYFTIEKVVYGTIAGTRYWTVGDLRTFEFGINTSESFYLSKNSKMDIMITANYNVSNGSNTYPQTKTYFASYYANISGIRINFNIPLTTATFPSTWGTTLTADKVFVQYRIYN